jgi:hypothetical protein
LLVSAIGLYTPMMSTQYIRSSQKAVGRQGGLCPVCGGSGLMAGCFQVGTLEPTPNTSAWGE